MDCTESECDGTSEGTRTSDLVSELVSTIVETTSEEQPSELVKENQFNAEETVNCSSTGINSSCAVTEDEPQQEDIDENGPIKQLSTGLALIGQLNSSDDDSDSSESDNETSKPVVDKVCEDIELEELDDSGFFGGKKYGYPMTSGEIDYRDLPPDDKASIATLPVSVALTAVGKVLHTTERLTIIESYPNNRVINEGTLFWSSERTYVGKLFETLGPVKKPFYAVRDSEDLLNPGMEVFAALEDPTLTQYVFTDELMKLKGSDASWKNDHEVPAEHQDVSDDELEQAEKARAKSQSRWRQRARQQRKNSSQNVQNSYSAGISPFPAMELYYTPYSTNNHASLPGPPQSSVHYPPPPPPPYGNQNAQYNYSYDQYTCPLPTAPPYLPTTQSIAAYPTGSYLPSVQSTAVYPTGSYLPTTQSTAVYPPNGGTQSTAVYPTGSYLPSTQSTAAYPSGSYLPTTQSTAVHSYGSYLSSTQSTTVYPPNSGMQSTAVYSANSGYYRTQAAMANGSYCDPNAYNNQSTNPSYFMPR